MPTDSYRAKPCAIVSQARQALLDLLANHSLPVGIRQADGAVLVLVKDPRGLTATKARPEQGSSNPVDSSTLLLSEIVDLVENGLRGNDLQAILSAAPPDSAMGAYRNLVERLARSDINGQFKILESYEASLQDKPGIVGRIYRHSIADGNAYYMVTQVKGDKARLSHLDVCDGYSIPAIGRDGWIDAKAVRATIEWEQDFKKATAQRTPGP